jgi:hypothetical protein
MARAHFVKKARQDGPKGSGIKKGDAYWWWKFMVGGRGGPKHYSKTPPKRSMLTQSSYYSALYDIEDDIAALSASESIGDDIADIANRLNELADEQEEKLNNMPEGLQQGSSGEMLQERADACRAAAETLEAIECDVDHKGDDESAEDFWQSKLDEAQEVSVE